MITALRLEHRIRPESAALCSLLSISDQMSCNAYKVLFYNVDSPFKFVKHISPLTEICSIDLSSYYDSLRHKSYLLAGLSQAT